MVGLKKVFISDILIGIFGLVSDLLTFGLEVREFDPVEDICMDPTTFQFISMHKLTSTPDDIN